MVNQIFNTFMIDFFTENRFFSFSNASQSLQYARLNKRMKAYNWLYQ